MQNIVLRYNCSERNFKKVLHSIKLNNICDKQTFVDKYLLSSLAELKTATYSTVMKLVAMQDFDSCAARRESSNLSGVV